MRAHGLTEKGINNIDIKTIRNVLRNGVIVDSEKFSPEPDWSKNKLTANLKEKISKKKISEIQLRSLNNLGYTYEEIADMDIATVEALTGDVTIMAAPPGYVGPVTVPDGGGTNEYFHPSVAVDINSLNWYVSASKQYAQYHFNEYSNPLPSALRWSYYLYGEWDNIHLTHEGVDVRHTNGRPVRNVTGNDSHKGLVIKTGPELVGFVQVYDAYLNQTITYMHIGIPTVQPNQQITKGMQIGTQSVRDGHTHFQAFDGYSTRIPAAKYNTLECRIPYGFMTWWL